MENPQLKGPICPDFYRLSLQRVIEQVAYNVACGIFGGTEKEQRLSRLHGQFEARVKEGDPLLTLENAILESAQGADTAIALKCIEDLEMFILLWTNLVKANPGKSVSDLMREKSSNDGHVPPAVSKIIDPTTSKEEYMSHTTLVGPLKINQSHADTYPTARTLYPSLGFAENALRSLGILREDQSLLDLENEESKRSNNGFNTPTLETLISGISVIYSAGVFRPYHFTLVACFTPPVIEQMVSFRKP